MDVSAAMGPRRKPVAFHSALFALRGMAWGPRLVRFLGTRISCAAFCCGRVCVTWCRLDSIFLSTFARLVLVQLAFFDTEKPTNGDIGPALQCSNSCRSKPNVEVIRLFPCLLFFLSFFLSFLICRHGSKRADQRTPWRRHLFDFTMIAFYGCVVLFCMTSEGET